jgi:carbonic anhydrase
MKSLNELLENNRAWSEKLKASDAEFFQRLAQQQSPAYLWIGCSDSRVPSSSLVGLSPGEMFVHRNVANVVVHTDLNCLSVIQFAVEALAVRHIIVCGHYGCGGVQAALANSKLGLIDNWLRHVQDVVQKHARLLAQTEDMELRARQLCELNVIEQVVNVCQTTIVQQAWERGQQLSVHGWIYGLEDGLLRDLHIGITQQQEVAERYAAAIAAANRTQNAPGAAQIFGSGSD